MHLPKRFTNRALLLAMGTAFFTGWVAFFYGTAPSRWSLIVHASSGFAIIVLAPWKSLIAATAIRRRRPGWWLSLLFTTLIIVSVLAGILHSTGILRGVGAVSAMEVHVGAALVALPLALWHLARRWIPIRSLNVSRRAFLRTGTVAVLGGAAYASTEIAVRILTLPGARRRFTGSYEVASFQPDGLPATNWLFDPIPAIDASRWSLTLQAGSQVRRWSYQDLLAYQDQARATLDCTGGFYSTHDWTGVRLSRLIPSAAVGSSLHVRSSTGYDRRFPIAEATELLLATRVDGLPLSAGNGYPLRLVAPARRGYWWVKWVTSITVEDVPDWWQLPFPIQ